MSSDAISEFRTVLEDHGLRPENIIADGVLHRCPVDGKPRSKDGAYVLHLDAPTSGWWQNYRTGEAESWTSREERSLSLTERQVLKNRIEADRRAREAETVKRHVEAADKARRILAEAKECTAHHYLERKGVKPCPGLKIGTDGRLVVPVLGEDGKPMSLQFIAEDGGKLFLSGGRTRGGYFAIKGAAGPLYIVEGLATGLSIREATGQTVLCAFNAGNLEAVAVHARQKYPDRELVLCADNDQATDGNPGLTKGTAAALAVGGILAAPSFKNPIGQTDFNDLHQAEGIEVVRDQVANAAMPGLAKVPEDLSLSHRKGWELARQLFPRTPFPWDVLPEAIASSLKQLGRSCATSPTSLAALSFCLIASAVGRRIYVEAKGSWHEPIIFWFADLRESGAGKTSAMFKLAEVFDARQADEDERYKAEMEEWTSLMPKDRKGKHPPKKPRAYFTTNMTLEGVHSDLDDHPTGGLSVLLNELSAFISSQNQYKKHGTDRESWLALHDGKSIRISRAKGSVFLKGARVQVYGGTQPAIFRQVFGGGNGQYIDDGTIYRFLLSYEPSSHYELNAESWSEANRQCWNATLATALDWADRQNQSQQLKLAPEAQERFFDWRNTLNAKQQDLPPRFRNFLPKAFGYALRLAGVIHAMACFVNGFEPQEELNLADMERGIKAASFYLGQAVDALRLLMVEGDAELPTEVSERSALLAMVLNKLRDKVDCGRLAVGFLQDEYNKAASTEEQMKSARELGSLLRSCGLTVLSTKHDANGRRRVCCLSWDTKTDLFIASCQGESRQLGGRTTGRDTGCPTETLETSANNCLCQDSVDSVVFGDVGDVGDNTQDGHEIPDMVTI
jgi:phage/plasmid primase-like uncharacterized protein